jgi:hypothetical protein
MMDAAIVSSLMNRHNYYHYPTGYYSEPAVVHGDGLTIFIVFIVVIGIFVVVAFIVSKD